MVVSNNLIPNLLRAFCSLIFLCCPHLSLAAEWWTEPSVRLSQVYNDNFGLQTKPVSTVKGTSSEPRMNFGVRSELWQLDGGLRFVQQRYSGGSARDRDDQFYRLGSLYSTERSLWRLGGTLTKVSTLNIEEFNPDIGLVEADRERKTETISPSLTWSMTERMQLQLSLLFSDVSFDENSQRTGLFDYRFSSVSVQLSNQLSAVNSIFASVGYSFFRVPFTNFESETTNLQFGATCISSRIRDRISSVVSRRRSLT